MGWDSLLSFYSFPGYCSESKNRSRIGRGDLALLVRDSLQYKVRDDLEFWLEGEFENFSIEVGFEEKNFLFCIIYRPPTAMFDRFIAGFDDLMVNIRNSGLEFVIMGDLNYDLKILVVMNLDFFNFNVISRSIPCGHTSYEYHRAFCDLD